MKKFNLLLVLALTINVGLFAQHYIDVQAGNTYPIGVTLQNSISGVTYDWTLDDVANDILSNDADITSATGTGVSIIIRGTATNGQTAIVSVTGNNGSCAGTTQNATIRVGVATFVAAFGSASQSICEGDNSAAVAVNITVDGAAVGAVASTFVYYIDANNNGIQDGGEGDVTGTIAANVGSVPTALYASAGINVVRIKSVAGTHGANTVSSPQTAVNHTITVNERPDIIWF